MKLHDIQLMDVNQKYWLPPNFPLPSFLEIENFTWRVIPALKAMPLDLFDSNNMRTILVRSHKSTGHAYIHYLYWQSGKDLSMIDKKVISGLIGPDDFSNALVCKYNYIRCIDSCQRQWHVLIAVDINYFVSPSRDKNIDKLRMFQQSVCPNCGTDFRIPVVRIFDTNLET